MGKWSRVCPGQRSHSRYGMNAWHWPPVGGTDYILPLQTHYQYSESRTRWVVLEGREKRGEGQKLEVISNFRVESLGNKPHLVAWLGVGVCIRPSPWTQSTGAVFLRLSLIVPSAFPRVQRNIIALNPNFNLITITQLRGTLKLAEQCWRVPYRTITIPLTPAMTPGT